VDTPRGDGLATLPPLWQHMNEKNRPTLRVGDFSRKTLPPDGSKIFNLDQFAGT
jgi:hypothetical protein